MHPELLRLGRLTDLDTALHRARAELAAARGAIAAATAALKEAEGARDLVDAENRKAKTRERAAHTEIAEYQTRLKKAEKILETGAGDPAAAERQRVQCIDIIDRFETEELEAMDAVEAIRKPLEAAIAKVAAAAAALADVTSKTPARIVGAEAEVARLDKERAVEAAALPRDSLGRYENLAAKKHPAVVRIDASNTCPKCQFVVPIQLRIEAEKGTLPTCRGCGRWLLFV